MLTRNTNIANCLIVIITLILCLLPLLLMSQKRVTGIISSDSGTPVEGANIVFDNGIAGTITNKNGYFTITNPTTNDHIIEISALGYTNYFDTITESDTSLRIKLSKSPINLNEVNIINSINNEEIRSTSKQAEIINHNYIDQHISGSLMQSLSKMPGINSISIGNGLSKPVIRGLSYYRVVFAEYGIKREEQQWSNHNGLSVDQNNIENLEIVFGPGALEFGTDAIGGIINILPSYISDSHTINGEITLTGKTNSQWYGISGKIAGRTNKLYSIASFTYNNFGDFTIPETDYYILPTPASSIEGSHKIELGSRVYNTAGKEKALNLQLGYIDNSFDNRLIFEYHSNKNGFFNYSGIQYDSIRKEQENSYRDIKLPYQEIVDYSISNLLKINNNKNQIIVNSGFQMNISDEYSFLTDRTGNRYLDLVHYRNKGNLSVKLKLLTLTLNGKYCITSIGNHSISIGIASQYQNQTTDGYDHILPAYSRLSTGLFITDIWPITENLNLHYGIRIDNYSLNIDETINSDPEYGDSIFNKALTKSYLGKAISAGLVYTNNTITYKVNIGNSYRIPSIYELSAYGLHRHDIRFEIGDINLEPEKAWQIDVCASRQDNNFYLSVSPFLYYFTNYIYLFPTSELRSEGQIWQYRQNKTVLTGGEVTANYELNNTQINIGVEYVYAVNLDLQSALPSTPPASANIEITQNIKKGSIFSNNSISLNATAVAAQNYTVINELSTPGYMTFGFKAQTTINLGNQQLKTLLIIDNLLNNKYFNHLSMYRRLRIPEPGRNIQLLLTIPI